MVSGRPHLARQQGVFGLTISLDGGFEEFDEFFFALASCS